MAEYMSYYEFLRETAELGRERFMERVHDPYLYFFSLPDLGSEEIFASTQVSTSKLARQPNQPSVDPGTQAVIAVRKENTSNEFHNMITIGRAGNNDLQLPDFRVSRFHAYFRKTGEQWTLTDAESSNGTWVDNLQLETLRPYRLFSGAAITFAQGLGAVFLEPNDLYYQVQQSMAWLA